MALEGAENGADYGSAHARRLVSVVSMPAAVVLVVTILVIGLLRRSHRRAVWAVVAVVGANLTTQILKYQFLWRPDFNITERWDNANTLPSGHTTMAASAAVALILLSGRRWRPLSAWAGGLFTVAMGYSTLVCQWHRPSDVITAALIAGAWALALSPIERRPRHGAKVQRVMVWASLGLIVIALLATGAAMWGFSMSAASPGSGYGFEDFLQIRPWRSRVLGVAAVAWVSAVCGLIMHEVDRLAGE